MWILYFSYPRCNFQAAHAMLLKSLTKIRCQVDQQGQMSDAAALKILNRLNTEMEATQTTKHRSAQKWLNKAMKGSEN